MKQITLYGQTEYCKLDDILLKLTDFKPQIGENLFYIYVLTEQNTKNIRYVGITVNPTKRYNGHLNDEKITVCQRANRKTT